jgi:hypothetical protein
MPALVTLGDAVAVDYVRLNPWVCGLPGREVDVEFAASLRLGVCAREMDFNVVSVATFDHAVGALEKGAEVAEGGRMANEDVQGRRRAPELPQRGRISHCAQNPRSVNCERRGRRLGSGRCGQDCGVAGGSGPGIGRR